MSEGIIVKAGGFGYGGKWVFNGEIIELRGLRNDALLLDIGYVVRYGSSDHEHSEEMEEQGRRFVGDSHRLAFLRQQEEGVEDDEFKSRRSIPEQAEIEHNAIQAAGLTPAGDTRGSAQVSMAGTAVAEKPAKPECPMCDRPITQSQMKRHVVACARRSEEAEDEE